MAETKPRSVPLPLGGPAPAINKDAWYAKGLSFECSQCGNCCSGSPGYVWITIPDMEKIAEYLGLEFDDFSRTYVRRVGNKFSLIEKFNYDCVFLTRDGRGKSGCRIYPVRPMQCRTWPFWDENLKAPNAWERASAKCPGMCDADAPRYDLAHIEKCRQHSESPH